MILRGGKKISLWLAKYLKWNGHLYGKKHFFFCMNFSGSQWQSTPCPAQKEPAMVQDCQSQCFFLLRFTPWIVPAGILAKSAGWYSTPLYFCLLTGMGSSPSSYYLWEFLLTLLWQLQQCLQLTTLAALWSGPRALLSSSIAYSHLCNDNLWLSDI